MILIIVSVVSFPSTALSQQRQTKRPSKTAVAKPAPVFTILSNPPGSEVFIDGKSRGVTNDEGTLALKDFPKGKHRITVKHEGYKDLDDYVTFTAGGDYKAELDKDVLTLIVQAPPDCHVWIDGENRGQTDANGKLSVANLTAGSHSIIVRGRGYAEASKSFVLASDNSVAEIKLERDPEWPVIQKFEDALSAGQLVAPANASAFSAYLRLMRDDKAHPELSAMREKLLKRIDDRGNEIISKISQDPNRIDRDLLNEGRDLFQATVDLKGDQKFTARLHYFNAQVAWHDNPQRGKNRDRQLQTAKTEFQSAIDIDPTFAAAHHDLAVLAYNETGDYATASRSLKAATDADSQWALPHFTLGRIYIDQHRVDEAMLEFQKSMKLDPALAQAKAGLGIAFALSGDAPGGLKLAEAAASAMPKNAYVHYALARIHIESGEYQIASNEMDQAIRLNDMNMEFNNDDAKKIMKDAPKHKKH